MNKSYKDLEAYQLSFDLAMEIFNLTRNFSKTGKPSSLKRPTSNVYLLT